MSEDNLFKDELAAFMNEAQECLSRHEEELSKSYCYDFKQDRPKSGGKLIWQATSRQDNCLKVKD